MKNFRTIRIFISSTFRDMDFERDEIKFKVIPRLNAHYANYGLTFQTVDLRIGVNTTGLAEEVRENKVLDVCLNSIEQSRPFFIGLIGGRYGWIPSTKRFSYILNNLSDDKRPLISGAKKRSVTELEILYGAIGDKGQYINHSLFFFRNPASYNGMDEETLTYYTDFDTQEQHERLEKLRQHIVESTLNTPAAPVHYSIEWNSIQKKFIDKDNTFANTVYKQITNIIDADIASEKNEQPWYNVLADNDTYIVNNYLTDVSPRRECIEQVAKRLARGGRMVMSGEKGKGKSTFLSLLVNYLISENPHPVLMAFPSTDSNSLSPRILLAKWINIIAQQSNMVIPFASIESLGDIPLNQLSEMLDTIAQKANICPVVFIDDISLLELYSNEATYLSWIPKSFGLFVTVDKDYKLPALKIHSDIDTFSLPNLTEEDLNIYFDLWENRNSNELGSAIRQELLLSKAEPRRLALLLNLIGTFASDDFQQIRQQSGNDEMKKITQYIISVIKSAPTDITGIINYLINRVIVHDGDAVALKQSLSLLALSRWGLRDSDVETLIDDKFDMLAYTTLMSLLNYLFHDDRLLHKRNFKSNNLLQAYILGIANPKPYYTDLARHTLNLPDSDPLRRDMLLFFLIKSGNIKAIIDNLLFPPLDKAVKALAQDYYFASMQYLLLSEENLPTKILQTALGMDLDSNIIFLYNVLFHGFPDLFQRIDIMRKFAPHVFSIHAEEIKDARAAYALAWMQSEYLSIVRNYSFLSETEQIHLHKTTINSFIHSRRLNPEIGDPSNMIIAISSNLIPLYAKIGDFESMDEILMQL